ncbi:MAG TPA: YihY/virulence factor BrkB family protein [Candidatus Sulfobium mesophilum]|uniref:Putative YihY family protein n=1 Tax=Candidatus Sulfobium mesophilum TaxID=2016548 RepID=A0A2U3QK22_9BACT|nr:putative YihY family protein [Candidatus Sulfobium mesophilum]HSB29982.1 YihY/virulence factor BrkB family protein [Candidatus Sulfobium mesophilum]
MAYLRLIGKSAVDFYRDGGMMLAGSLSYFIVTALVPFCMFLTTLLGFFLGYYPEFHAFVQGRLTNLFPSVTAGITHEIINLISYKGLGKIGIILYGFMSYQVFASMENSLNVVFKVNRRRNIIYSILISLLAVTGIIVLLIVSFGAASVIPFLNALKPYFPDVRVGKLTALLIRFVLPFVLVLFTVTLMYKLLPRVKVKMLNAIQGALFTTIFLEMAKHIFTWYVVSIAHLGKIYGSLTAFIFFLLWMFYSSCIFLMGAEMVHNLGRKGRPRAA